MIYILIRLQRAFAKYGLGLFSFIVLEVLKSDPNKKEFKSKLLKLEQHYIDMISDKYNINSTAGSTLGYRHTEEAYILIGAASHNRTFSAATLAKFRVRRHSDTTLAKFRARRYTEESRKKN